MKREQEKIELKGRPKREKAINKDDILNLKIMLHERQDASDFIKKLFNE